MSTSQAKDLDDALAIIERSTKERKAVSVALLGNAGEVLPELLRRGVRPDIVTDQTSAHDPVNGYLPKGWSLEQWEERRASDPKGVERAAKASMGEHVRAMLAYAHAGVPTVDYGNNIRQMALEEGVKDAFDFPGFVPAYIRPLFCRGVGPFRWAALSGDPEDIFRTDAKVKELMPDDAHLHNWLDMARARIKFQGLPARICWVGLGDRHRLGLAFNEMVASGELKAPIVIGRDHLDSGSVASPNRETEAMQDGSDAVSDWPLLNALLNCASGATWVSIHHGGGVGMGYSQHAGMVIVCDGTAEAGAADRARVVERSGERRHAPRRRRLRGGDRLRAREGARSAEFGGVRGDPLRSAGAASVRRGRRDEVAILGLRPRGGKAVHLALGLAQAARKVRPHKTDERVHIRKHRPHPRRLVIRRRDDVRAVRAERRGMDWTLMPLQGDESRPLPAQIPHPCRLVGRRGDHMRSVGAERGGINLILMPLEEGNEGGGLRAQIPHTRRGLLVRRRDHMRAVGAERRGDDHILMFKGDEARRLRPQIPHPRRPVIRRRDHMRPVGAEPRGVDRALMARLGRRS